MDAELVELLKVSYLKDYCYRMFAPSKSGLFLSVWEHFHFPNVCQSHVAFTLHLLTCRQVSKIIMFIFVVG